MQRVRRSTRRSASAAKSCGADGVAFFDAWSTAELAKDTEIASTNPSGFRGMSLAWNCSSVAEVDRALARAMAAGATLIRSAQTVFWGGYTAYIADPDGHLWEVAHNPQFPFSADGRLLLPD